MALDQLLDELADRLAARVVSRLRDGEPGMVDQAASPLGARRHCAAVKRRLARGEGGAANVGRRFMLTPEALHEELERASTRRRPSTKAVELDPVEKLKRKLALVRQEGP
jgi:hypothetical protein